MDKDKEIENRLRDFYSEKTEGKYDAKPFRNVRILILEDDLRALSVLLGKLKKLEDEMKEADIAVTVLSEYTQVEEYINQTKKDFDVILLDRDCKSCGSFHVLDFEKYDPQRIISISAITEWNEEARERGVKRVILKDHDKIENFADKVTEEIQEILQKN